MSTSAASGLLRGNDAGRGKPRLYRINTGPFAGSWVCRDGISGMAGYGHPREVLIDRSAGSMPSDDAAARERAYDQWDMRSTWTRDERGWPQ